MFPEPNASTTVPTPATGGAPPPTPAESTPKKRGRPFGTRNRAPPLSETTVPPDSAAAPPEAPPERRKRRTKAIDKEALAKQLVGIHVIAAKLTGLPFVQIDQTEANMLSDAIENVAREYDLELTGKTGAFIQLIAASAIVYGPRVIMFQQLKRRMARGDTPQTVEGVATPLGPEVTGNGSSERPGATGTP